MRPLSASRAAARESRLRSRLLAVGLVAVLVAAIAGALAVSGGASGKGSAVGGGARPSATSQARLASADEPTTTPWPTPGFSAEELRPVADALVQLATGVPAAPVGSSPDTVAAASPPTTSPARVTPGGDAPGPGPSPSHRTLLWPVLVLIAGIAAALVLFSRRIPPRRRQHGHRLPSPPTWPPTAFTPGASDPTIPEIPISEPEATETAQRVDLALRHAWGAADEAGRAAFQAVTAVRIGELGVEVLLDRPVADAPGRFVAADGGDQWRLGPDVADEELREAAADQQAPLPALVTVGGTAEGPVLVDLVRAGTLSVEGDEARVAAFLAGVALELATAPWATELSVGLLGGDQRLDAGPGVTVFPSIAGGRKAETDATKAVGAWLERSPHAAILVVAPATAGPSDVAILATTLGAAASPAGLVAPGPIPGAPWRLVVDAAGGAVLHPLGLELACAVDAGAVAESVAALAGGPAHPPTQATEQSHPAVEQVVPGVGVLGPVVVRWPTTATRRRPVRHKLEEVVAYLATHGERPVPAERLRTALWPLSDDERAGEVADSSFRGTISRARAALGADAAGRPYLPEAGDGCYQLDAAVDCDWVEFTALVRQARSAPAPEAAALLRNALALVRGAPFADAPRGCYGWAWSEQLVSAIEVAVADAAERLAELALDAGDHATVRWASARGLLVVPSRESLYRARMRGAFEAGDVDDIEQAYVEVRRAARAVDDAEQPQAQTTALYERLRRAARPMPADQAADPTERLVPVS